MADIIKLAEEVAREIGEGAEVRLVPEFSLRDISAMHIVVVPAGLGVKPVARGYTEETHTVQVGVLKRCTEDELVDLVNTVVGLGSGFLERKLEGMRCVKVAYAPLYSPEHFREKRQFTGIAELTFVGVAGG